MNKIKTLAMGALIAVAGVGTAFAQHTQEEMKVFKKVAPPEYAEMVDQMTPEQFELVLQALEADPAFKAQYEEALKIATEPPPPPSKPAPKPGEPFSFDDAYAQYKVALDSNDIPFLVGNVEMDSLEKYATTPERQEQFKDFKAKYETFYTAILEKGNTNFADATQKLITRAWICVHYANKKAARTFVNEGIALYHQHVAGNKKGKATKVQLQDFYFNYRQIMMEKYQYGFDWIDYTPDGKKIKSHTTYNIYEHDVVRKNLGRPLGVLGSVSQNGKITHDGVYMGQVSFDGFIYNANGDEVGYLENDGKIRIRGKVVAEYKNTGYIGEARKCFIGGKYVGSIKDYSFSYADNKQIELERGTNGIFDAFVLFFYKVIPQK